MSTETKIFVAIIAATILLVGGAAVLLGNGNTTVSSNATTDQSILVKPSSHTIGPENAKVTIVEFSDFECPACDQVQPVVTQMLAAYKDKSVRFVYREFPLTQAHQYAQIAAQAAEAAGLQNHFWEMHDKLFQTFTQNPDINLTSDVLVGYAKDLGLDTTKFSADLNSDAVQQIISTDTADGNKADLSVTPTFFINGTKFDGGLTLDQFKQEIESRLK